MIEFEFVERIKKDKNFGTEGHCTKLPEKGTKKAAGYDFYYLDSEPTIIKPKEIAYVKTGVKATFPRDIALLLLNRSSNPKKKGLVLANGIGLIDADYYNNDDNEGEITFAFLNITDQDITINNGDKLGQGMFVKYYDVDNFSDKDIPERISGFGSTGI